MYRKIAKKVEHPVPPHLKPQHSEIAYKSSSEGMLRLPLVALVTGNYCDERYTAFWKKITK